MTLIAVCGGYSPYYDPPPPTRPRCANGHRARYMRLRVKAEPAYICDLCGAGMTWADNLARPENHRTLAAWEEGCRRYMEQEA